MDYDLGGFVAQYLKHLRLRDDLTQEQLAERIAPYKVIHHSALQKIESGTRKVSLDDLRAFAQAFAQTPAQFLTEALRHAGLSGTEPVAGHEVDEDALSDYAGDLIALVTSKTTETWRTAHEAQAKMNKAVTAMQEALKETARARTESSAIWSNVVELETNLIKIRQRLDAVRKGAESPETAQFAFPLVVDGASRTASDLEYAKHYGIDWYLERFEGDEGEETDNG